MLSIWARRSVQSYSMSERWTISASYLLDTYLVSGMHFGSFRRFRVCVRDKITNKMKVQGLLTASDTTGITIQADFSSTRDNALVATESASSWLSAKETNEGASVMTSSSFRAHWYMVKEARKKIRKRHYRIKGGMRTIAIISPADIPGIKNF